MSISQKVILFDLAIQKIFLSDNMGGPIPQKLLFLLQIKFAGFPYNIKTTGENVSFSF